jgi:hypothetical protein
MGFRYQWDGHLFGKIDDQPRFGLPGVHGFTARIVQVQVACEQLALAIRTQKAGVTHAPTIRNIVTTTITLDEIQRPMTAFAVTQYSIDGKFGVGVSM